MEEIIAKCVVVGDGTVGKTCLLVRYTTKEYSDTYTPTVFENYAVTESVKGKKVTLHLFDTAGQEEYLHLRTFSYSTASVFVVCFSVDCPESLENVKNLWIPEIRKHSKAPIILACTKVDLRDSGSILIDGNVVKMITKAEGQQLSKEIKASRYIECSAKDRINVENVFQEAIFVACDTKKSNNSCDMCRPFGKFFRIFRCEN